MSAPALRLRSPLFAPGDSARKTGKALASPADAVILDLEDSVAPAAKPDARAMVAGVLHGLGAEGASARVIVRVNPRGSLWYLADLAAVVPGRPAAVLLPKCESAADLVALDHHLEALETSAGLDRGGIGVLALVTETAASVLAMAAMADAVRAGPLRRVIGFCFGAEDLSADLGVTPRGPDGSYAAAVEQARAAMLVAAAVAGVPALDTPWPDPHDAKGLAREAARAARDGFVGKFCIHPAQIAATNAAFTPPSDRVAWARRVYHAFAANPGAGVLALDGRMIDRPHLKLAQRLLAAAGE